MSKLEELLLEDMPYCERSDCMNYFETMCLAGKVDKNPSGYTLWKFNEDGTKKPNDYSQHECEAFVEGENSYYEYER